MKYNVVVKEAENGNRDTANVVSNIEDFFAADTHAVSWKLALMTSTATTLTQYFSYEMSQFLGELGGSWGLFLGASLMSILDLVEGCLAKMMPRSSL
jgi:hypothetical protein